jgi:hypothetical protein
MMRTGAPSASEAKAQKETARVPRVPAIQRACEFQQLLDSAEVKNRAEIARRYGISRARVTQIMNLLRLPEAILDYLLHLNREEQLVYSERRLRRLAGLQEEPHQIQGFDEMRRSAGLP